MQQSKTWTHNAVRQDKQWNDTTTTLKATLQFYSLRTFMHDSIHALKVDETVQSAHLLWQQFVGGSSS